MQKKIISESIDLLFQPKSLKLSDLKLHSLNDDNDLIKLLNKYPNNNWNWYALSANPNITLQFIKNNYLLMDKWNIHNISSNPNLTWEIVENNLEFNWNWKNITCNPNITLEIIESNPKYFNNKDDIARNPNNIVNKSSDTWNLYLQTPDKYVDYAITSRNPNFTWETIISYPTRLLNWDWNAISRNPNITWENIISNLHLPWNWDKVLENPNVMWEDIKLNKKKILQSKNCKIIWWYHFSYNPNLTYEIVVSNSRVRWCWLAISSNLFKKHPVLHEKRRKAYIKTLERIFNNI